MALQTDINTLKAAATVLEAELNEMLSNVELKAFEVHQNGEQLAHKEMRLAMTNNDGGSMSEQLDKIMVMKRKRDKVARRTRRLITGFKTQ